jgi:tetratricopeptide (TPR) repeat protein
MPESRGVQRGSPGSCENAVSGEALYQQAMAHYRRREWQQAREDLMRLKAVEPGRRGIDAVLDELAIFIRLDSLPGISTTAPSPARPRSSIGALLAKARWRVPAGLAGVALVAAVAFFAYHLITARAAGRIHDLHSRAPALAATGDWSRAIDAYEEWLLLAPGDAEARDGLWAAYYARGDERARAAQALEEQEQYAQAAEQWQGALADFRAAQQVDPQHPPEPRGAPLERVSAAQKGKLCATLLKQALDLSNQRRWPEVIYALQQVQAEDATYRSDRVADYLCEALLESGQEALAAARSPDEIQDAVDLIERAAQAQPSATWAQMALWEARSYLQGATSAQARDWDAAVRALEPLLREAVDLTGGRARDLLCQAQKERANARYQAGQLRDALADYQAVEARCGRDPSVQARAAQISLSLTPAPLPAPTPALAPAAAAVP